MFSTIQNSALHITSLGDSDIYLHTETDGATHRWTMTHDAGGYRLESYDMGFGYMTYGTPTANNPDGTVWIDYPMTYQAKNYWNFVPVSNDLTLNEGAASTLSAAGISGTITWGSSNETVATVNASGVVTAVRAGRATVTARVNGAVQRTYNILVTIPDGQYLINHCASTYFLTPNVISYGTYTAINTASRATDNVVALSQIWNIKHQGGGYYTVTTIYKDDLRMTGFTGSHPSLDTRTTNDVHKWKIEYSSNGYTFVNAEYNQSALTGNSTNAEIVTLSDYSETDTNQRWQLTSNTAAGLMLLDSGTGERVDYNARVSVTVSPPASGTLTRSLSDLGIEVKIFDNTNSGSELMWESSDANVAEINLNTGQITIKAAGGTVITARRTINNTVHTVSYKLSVIRETILAQAMYDAKYLSKHPNAPSRISTYMEELQRIYLFYLETQITFSAPYQYVSYADKCSTLDSDDHCNCGTSVIPWHQACIHKHSYLERNLEDMEASISYKRLAFIGHDTCHGEGADHHFNSEENAVLGLAYVDGATACVSHTTYPGTNDASELKTAVHEFGHLLGAEDHYNGGNGMTTEAFNELVGYVVFSEDCIFGENKDKPHVYPYLTICEGCIMMMRGELVYP